jgi:hypothetical protein
MFRSCAETPRTTYTVRVAGRSARISSRFFSMSAAITAQTTSVVLGDARLSFPLSASTGRRRGMSGKDSARYR